MLLLASMYRIKTGFFATKFKRWYAMVEFRFPELVLREK